MTVCTETQLDSPFTLSHGTAQMWTEYGVLWTEYACCMESARSLPILRTGYSLQPIPTLPTYIRASTSSRLYKYSVVHPTHHFFVSCNTSYSPLGIQYVLVVVCPRWMIVQRAVLEEVLSQLHPWYVYI